MKIENILPDDIEKRSFEIISETLGNRTFDNEHESIIKRCIHTSADFDYADNLYFSKNVVPIIKKAFIDGADIVTDTQMAKAGINKTKLSKLGGKVHCFISDDDVIEEAKKRGVTRSFICMEKTKQLTKSYIIAVGNAPTALISIKKLLEKKEINPVAIIGTPVGFVNVIESKSIIMNAGIPCIVSKGRKGGSNIVAAICNAILYQI